MKIVLDVDTSVVGLPTNSVMLYDGNKWYVTTKEKLLQDLYKDFGEIQKNVLSTEAKLIESYSKLEKEFAKYKKDVSKQLTTMANIIDTYIK